MRTVTNEYTAKPGTLTIRKAIKGDPEGAEDKTFTFEVKGPDGFSETVTAKADAPAEIKDIPAGDYTVSEVTENRSADIDG